MNSLRGAIAVFIGAASFGVLSTFVKKAYAYGYSLGEVTGVQALLGMVILWITHVIISKSKSSSKSYLKQTKPWKIMLAGVSTGLVSILYYKCVELVPASLAIVLLMQFIWISAIINFFLYKQKPSKRQGIGIFLILGATLLATGVFEDSFHTISVTGIIFGLLAAIAYAIFIIVNGKVGNDYPPSQKSALMVTGAFLFILITLQPTSLLSFHVEPKIYEYGLILAVFGTVLPPFLFAYGLPKIGVSLGSILSAVELPVAVTMSYFVLKEKVSLYQWIGVALILLFVIWINSKQENKWNKLS